MEFFKEHFDEKTLEMLKNFPGSAMAADFWRYAVIYFYGGIYMDIDTTPLKPVREFRHYPFDEKRVILALETEVHLC